MGIMSRIKNAVTGNKESEYTPERAEGLRNAMAMAKDRQDFEKNKYEFEKQQAESKPGRRILRTAYRAAKSFGEHFEPRKNPGFANRGMIRQNIARSVGQSSAVNYQGKKGYQGRGRPKGPSGRYFIPGVGSVGVYQYRKWASQQKQARRMAYEQQMQAIQQNPELAQAYAEGRISPEQISESEVINTPQSTNYPRVIPQQPSQNPMTQGFNALNVPNPFNDIEKGFMGKFGPRRNLL